MTRAPHIQHLHIGRITLEAEPGADRHALRRALQLQLPAAIAARLQAGARQVDGPCTADPLADAVAQRVVDRVNGELPR